jgi:hypothetical protein
MPQLPPSLDPFQLSYSGGTGTLYITPPQALRKDGIVFGLAWTATSWEGLAVAKSPNALPSLKWNDECQAASGVTKGKEWVYDFKHQEFGLFDYSGSVRNLFEPLAGSVTTYIGQTMGFVNASYEDGVEAYKGGFKSDTFSGNNIAAIEAQPLDNYGKVNPNGVFATYYGFTVGTGIIPFGYESAVTNYVPVEGSREQYLLGEVSTNALPSVIKRKKMDINHRKKVAVEMADDIRWQFVQFPYGNVWPISNLRNQAFIDLQDFT